MQAGRQCGGGQWQGGGGQGKTAGQAAGGGFPHLLTPLRATACKPYCDVRTGTCKCPSDPADPPNPPNHEEHAAQCERQGHPPAQLPHIGPRVEACQPAHGWRRRGALVRLPHRFAVPPGQPVESAPQLVHSCGRGSSKYMHACITVRVGRSQKASCDVQSVCNSEKGTGSKVERRHQQNTGLS